MNKVRFCLGLIVLVAVVSMAAGARAGCGSIFTSNGSCLYFGLPDPDAASDRGALAATAAARVGGVLCGLGNGEPLVAGHAASCQQAGGTVQDAPGAAPVVGAGSLAGVLSAGFGGSGPIIGYAPVTQYVPVFAVPVVQGGGSPRAVACMFEAVRLNAASVEDCERAGGTVDPAAAAE